MADTTLPGVLLKGTAAARPAANTVAKGTIYSATDTGAITQSDGSSWSTFATISSGLADPMTTRGDIIIRNASNTTARLGIGSSGKVLSSDGTDISWQTPASAGALVFLESHQASSSASLAFTTFVSSLYDSYLVSLERIAPASNAVNLQVVMGYGGTPTYDTGANYNQANNGYTSGGAANQFAAGSQTSITLANSVSNNAGYGYVDATYTLYNVGATTQRRHLSGTGVYANSTPAQVYFQGGGTWEDVTNALTALKFSFSSGNIASGTIRIYGIAKS